VAEASAFEARGDFIDGGFVLPTQEQKEIPFEDPGDLDAPRSAFPFSYAALDPAVDAAQRAYPSWRDAGPDERALCLRRLADAIQAGAERLADVIARDAGKPLWEARTEVNAMLNKVEITLDAGLDMIREQHFEVSPGQIAYSRPHARGVLAVLGPFNFPAHLPHGHVVPALATGNTVVIKPSERTPAVGQVYAELAAQAEFPPGVFNLIQGDGTLGAKLAAHPEVHGVLFTGSYAVGRRILESTLDQPWKLVALEMGGKNGVLVCDDADLKAAVHAIAFGATVTAGQRCSATSRVIVDRRVAAELVGRLSETLRALRIGYALDEDVFMGPVISAQAREHHARVLELAHEEGTELLVAGGPIEGPRRGHYVHPSLHRVPCVSRDSRYQCEEHFVPDVFVVEVDSFEEGMAALDTPDYGLVGSVFTRQRARFEQVFRESRLGLLNWNTSTVGASSKLPFGGVGRSGNDRPAGVLSTAYCTYPVASLEIEEPGPPPKIPGFPSAR
jgi:succinylglutamic semialdehyde dehydrogenase